MPILAKNWDKHVVHAEDVSRVGGFRDLRERITARAELEPDDVVADLGAGTGLLSLALADDVQRVWAIDISPRMSEYLRVKAASAGLENIETVTASVLSLPLVDRSVTVVVSNYCLHHLRDADKRRALAEIHRVLRPGGRLVIGDMMFSVGLARPRDRRVMRTHLRAMLRKGPAGVARLARAAARLLTGRWEHPAPSDWWQRTLAEQGFVEIDVEPLAHEGGIAYARRP